MLLTDYFPPHVGGGVERVVSELVDGLGQRGHTIGVLTLQTCPAPATETNESLTIRRVPAVDLTQRLGLQQAVSVRLLGATARFIRGFQPDMVHAHNLFFRTTEVAAFLRMKFRVPLVTTMHVGQSEGGSRLFRTLVKAYESTMGRFIVRRSDHIIAVAQAVAEHAHRIGGNSASVTVVPNGVDTGLFYPKQDDRHIGQVVLFVGRLVSNKGPEVLIRAVPKVLSRHPHTRFVLVGDGPLRDRLKQMACNLGIRNEVQFLGIRHDVPQLMRDAAIFVRPSSLEGMSLTVLEAMATGLPVVATLVGGTSEVLRDGVHGYLVPAGDSQVLADALIKMLDERSLAEEMGRRGRELVVSNYKWDAVVNKTESVYFEEVSRR
ncbi:MAG: glycosyltransferase family 4 protein [Dehalococcoidales bacterium]|nr:glycosyltransferase family 4 protein [Dehalococcoidales bacterium]